MKITILNYGIGNLKSIKAALIHLGHTPVISSAEEEILSSDGLILPGVGAFATAMNKLKSSGLDVVVKKMSQEDKPILGICLGMQLLFDSSEEFGLHEGLGIIKGKVLNMRTRVSEKARLPHVGWGSLIVSNSKETLFQKNFKRDVYFVHSYFCKPEDPSVIMSETSYDTLTFCSAVSYGNIYGCQFHPEKSGEVGLEILESFCNKIKSRLIGEKDE